ncbi:hypothetical protein R6Q59_009665 [Mikania micrantha]
MYFQVSIDLRRFRHKLDSQFVGVHRRLGFCKPTSRIGPSSNGSKSTCWFKLGKNGVDAEVAGIYGSQSRDDFDRDDVEQAFNVHLEICSKFWRPFSTIPIEHYSLALGL